MGSYYVSLTVLEFIMKIRLASITTSASRVLRTEGMYHHAIVCVCVRVRTHACVCSCVYVSHVKKIPTVDPLRQADPWG